MAHIRKRRGAWQSIVRVNEYPPEIKTFKTMIDAVRFSRDLENKLLRLQHDIDKKKFPLLEEALLRYQQEIVPLKRSAEMKKKLIKYISAEGFVNCKLNLIDPNLIAQYRERSLRSVKSSFVNRRLAILSRLFTIAKKEWGYDVVNLQPLN